MDKLVEVKRVKKHFPVVQGVWQQVRGCVKAVDGVSFVVRRGQTFGLVGESGCGKTTLGRSILRLIEPNEGEVCFEGKDILKLSKSEMLLRRREMQIVFQDPFGSLNPRMTVKDTLLEPLRVHGIGTSKERRKKIEWLLEIVGLRAHMLRRFPHEFSGGQRQRLGIARALAVNPKFIVADEPVSALDVSIQSQIINLLRDLQKQLSISFLFISHDLAIVQQISHEVGVMYLGKLVERARVESLYGDPRHPYTRMLFSAVLSLDPAIRSQILPVPQLPAEPTLARGCAFCRRCGVAEPVCFQREPEMVNIGTDEEEHFVRCHLYR